MPTKRRRIARGRTRPPLSSAEARYLLSGERKGGGWPVLKLSQGDRLRAAWAEFGPALLRDWIRDHPGTRPWAWWKFDAPRWRAEDVPLRHRGFASVADVAEPRRRLGGIGTPSYEVLNVAPEFRFGIPTSWVTRWQVDYYNARSIKPTARSVWNREYCEGYFVGDAIDATDPPRFEPEAGYLDRHDLLSAEERRRLPAEAFEPEVLDCGAEAAA